MYILFRNYNDPEGNIIIDELLSDTICSKREDAIVALRTKFRKQIWYDKEDYVERENVTLKQSESTYSYDTPFDSIIIKRDLLNKSIASEHFYIRKMQLV